MCCRFSDSGTLLAVGLIDGSIKVSGMNCTHNAWYSQRVAELLRKTVMIVITGPDIQNY